MGATCAYISILPLHAPAEATGQLAPVRTGRKKRKGPDPVNKLPVPTPNSRCKLKLLKLERIKDHLLLEEEFIANQCACSFRLCERAVSGSVQGATEAVGGRGQESGGEDKGR